MSLSLLPYVKRLMLGAGIADVVVDEQVHVGAFLGIRVERGTVEWLACLPPAVKRAQRAGRDRGGHVELRAHAAARGLEVHPLSVRHAVACGGLGMDLGGRVEVRAADRRHAHCLSFEKPEHRIPHRN